jgi:hypothetical protein
VDDVISEPDIWHNLMALTRITASNVVNAIPRINWTTGLYYDMYRHDYGITTNQAVDLTTGSPKSVTSLSDCSFFVVTDSWNVYKCLNNRNSSNVVVPSTVKPTGTTTSPFTTSDGYVWKFMYQIYSTDVINFVSTDFIPVKIIVSAPAPHRSLLYPMGSSAGFGARRNTYCDR